MIKKYFTRLFAIVCLCCCSLLIKSEDKTCTTKCVLSVAAMDTKHAAVEKEKTDNEPLTYFGFYSKF